MSERAAKLHDSPWQGVLYVTGGGTALLTELLTQPGASRTVLEARVPYAGQALTELLGRTPDQACSDSTARALAMAAFQRASALRAADHNATETATFGLACTASLATDRVKRGTHRAHIALQTLEATYTAEVALGGTRQEEEEELVECLWHAISLTLRLKLDDLPMRDLVMRQTQAQRHWRSLILGETLVHPSAANEGSLLFPGAFNPLHHAHERMLAIAEEKTGLAGAFELSLLNVDKPLLDYTEIDSRLKQFTRPVWLTRLPTFIEKARQFPGTTFVVGVDTLIRIVEPRYYGGSAAARDEALAELAELGTRFVVFGRRLDSRFVTLKDLALPPGLAARCIEVTQDEFDEPVSSTELRQRRP